MKVHIRLESQRDFRETETLTREAFWDLYRPGYDEHLIVHNLRNTAAFVPELDFVTTFDNKIIGSIMYSKAKVIDDQNIEHEVLCMGPLSVLPSYQKKGVGSKLIEHSTDKAREMGFTGVILFGNPDYYHRFGFKNAKKFFITTKDGQNFEPFMALELKNNGFANIQEKFFEDSAFETQADDLNEFEKNFPFKEKLVTDTQFKH